MGQLVVVNFASLDGVMQSVLSADEDRDGGFDQGSWVPDHEERAQLGGVRRGDREGWRAWFP